MAWLPTDAQVAPRTALDFAKIIPLQVYAWEREKKISKDEVARNAAITSHSSVVTHGTLTCVCFLFR